jgi:hypothetical protein
MTEEQARAKLRIYLDQLALAWAMSPESDIEDTLSGECDRIAHALGLDADAYQAITDGACDLAYHMGCDHVAAEQALGVLGGEAP